MPSSSNWLTCICSPNQRNPRRVTASSHTSAAKTKQTVKQNPTNISASDQSRDEQVTTSSPPQPPHNHSSQKTADEINPSTSTIKMQCSPPIPILADRNPTSLLYGTGSLSCHGLPLTLSPPLASTNPDLLLAAGSSPLSTYSESPPRSYIRLDEDDADSALTDVPRRCQLSRPILCLFTHLAQQCVHVSELFRRPGNIVQIKELLNDLNEGVDVDWTTYNVYTVANVAKRILLAIPGGLFGEAGEKRLLDTCEQGPNEGSPLSSLDDNNSLPIELATALRTAAASKSRSRTYEGENVELTLLWLANHGSVPLDQLPTSCRNRLDICLEVLQTLPKSHYELSVILLGILHQMVFHVVTSSSSNSPESASRSDLPLCTVAEGVVKSVAGAMFHTGAASVERVEQTADVLRTLVLYFPLLGQPITRIYDDALANRLLPLSNELTALNSHLCIICPDQDYCPDFHLVTSNRNSGGSQSHHHQSVNRPLSLRQAASRLFCLSTPSPPPQPQPSSQRRKRRQWRSTGGNSQRDEQRISDEPVSCQSERSIPVTSDRRVRYRSEPLPEPDLRGSSSKRVSSSGDDQFLLIQPSSTMPQKSSIDSADDCDPKPKVFKTVSIYENTDDLERMKVVHSNINNNDNISGGDCPQFDQLPRLRRNLSRYRSFRRRQMENLSRRAEWFLSPTTIPTIKVSLLLDPPHFVTTNVTSDLDDVDDDHSYPATANPGSLQVRPNLTTCLTISPPPRLIYTGSTGALEEGRSNIAGSSDDNRCGGSFADNAPLTPISAILPGMSSLQGESGGSSCHLLGIDYIHYTPNSPTTATSRSFTSLHSAPSVIDNGERGVQINIEEYENDEYNLFDGPNFDMDRF